MRKRGKCKIEYKQSGNTNFVCLKLRFSPNKVVGTWEWFYNNILGYDVTNNLNRTWNLGLSRDWRFLGPNHIGNLMGYKGIGYGIWVNQQSTIPRYDVEIKKNKTMFSPTHVHLSFVFIFGMCISVMECFISPSLWERTISNGISPGCIHTSQFNPT